MNGRIARHDIGIFDVDDRMRRSGKEYCLHSPLDGRAPSEKLWQTGRSIDIPRVLNFIVLTEVQTVQVNEHGDSHDSTPIHPTAKRILRRRAACQTLGVHTNLNLIGAFAVKGDE